MIPALHHADLGLNKEPERCCLCWGCTLYWTNLPDRPAHGQVPCCEPCARKAAPVQIPGVQAYRTLLRAKSEVALRRPERSRA